MIEGVPRVLKDRSARLMMEGHYEALQKVKAHEEYLLVVLDACRYDMFKDVHHLFLDGEAEPRYTPARDTFEYVQTMWRGTNDVTYVSGAVPINSVRVQYEEEGDFESLYNGYKPVEHLEEIIDVWKTGWDNELGTVPPRKVTEAALENDHKDRVVAHYFQPHAPYIGEDSLLGHTGEEHRPNHGKPNDELIWRKVKEGEIPLWKLRQAYRSNLIHALKEVKELVEKTQHSNVYVTGDHGEALGEYGVYAHPRKPKRHPKIHTVPFLKVA